MIRIIAEKCTGCGLCVKACPTAALAVEEKLARFIEVNCVFCAVCVPSCPHAALKMERKAVTADVSAFKGVWTFVEQHAGKVKNVSLELLGKGRQLADELSEPLCAVLLGGEGSSALAGLLGENGADKIYSVESPALQSYNTDAYTDAMSLLITKHKPSIVLYGATHVGRDLAPSVASNLALGLTADCTGLSIEQKDRLLLQTRPAFGGNVMADIVCPNTRPQMATVRPNVMPMPKPQPGRKAELIADNLALNPKKIRTQVLETILAERAGAKGVEEADAVVAGGRGVGDDGFAALGELAGELDAAVGCSRPMVEKGCMPKAAQVGQSGKTISPKLYIAAGISGAIQHEVGIRSSGTIISINTDESATIFGLSDLAVVGDARKIVPAITDEIRRRKALKK